MGDSMLESEIRKLNQFPHAYSNATPSLTHFSLYLFADSSLYAHVNLNPTNFLTAMDCI